MDTRPQVALVTERHVRVRVGERIDADLNARVHSLDAWLQSLDLPDRVAQWPAYAELLIEFRPGLAVAALPSVQQAVATWLSEHSGPVCAASGPCFEIPVSMSALDGPDLIECAAHCGLSPEVWRDRFLASSFQVALIGFQPGFPYLLGLDPTLAVPRRATPRRSVPAGSVAIAGAQAGIYPAESPGGWQLVGRTTIRLFDPSREPACLLQPGQSVRFVTVAP
ncbi:MAG: 5-oxoprolinase subunit PxpB [Ahniella sp.]|nr:5-oxoprolinase subunit PxpB [Ahniella sp.]